MLALMQSDPITLDDLAALATRCRLHAEYGRCQADDLVAGWQPRRTLPTGEQALFLALQTAVADENVTHAISKSLSSKLTASRRGTAPVLISLFFVLAEDGWRLPPSSHS